MPDMDPLMRAVLSPRRAVLEVAEGGKITLSYLLSLSTMNGSWAKRACPMRSSSHSSLQGQLWLWTGPCLAEVRTPSVLRGSQAAGDKE